MPVIQGQPDKDRRLCGSYQGGYLAIVILIVGAFGASDFECPV